MDKKGLLFGSGVLVLSWFISKPVFFITLFMILDIAKNIIELSMPRQYFPIKVAEIGIIATSIAYSYWCGFILTFIYIANKICFAKFQKENLFDVPILLTVSFLADMFSSHSFVAVAISSFLLRYLLSGLVTSIMTGDALIYKVPGRLINSVVAYFMFLNIATII
jgi:hypothetical protein